jgi:GTP-binding protein
VDSRHEPQKADLDFINRLGEWQIPFAVVFTKADKTTQRETARNVDKFLTTLKETWESLPPHFVTSAEKHLGKKGILQFIAEQNGEFEQHKRGTA